MCLSLNCFVLGDDLKKTFTVEIKKTENVSILKDMIKEKKAPHLDHVAASDLDLWKANLPLHGLEAAAVNFPLNNSNYPMLVPPIAKLSSFFEDAPYDECIHIIAKAPVQQTLSPISTQPLSLNCFVLGDDAKKMFTVEILNSQNVSILKDMIKEKKAPHLDHVAASDLDLFHVCIPLDENADERLKNVNLDLEPLKPHLSLSEVLSHVKGKHLHIVVQVSTNKSLATKDVEEEGKRDQISGLHKRFYNLIACISKAMPPSESAKSSTYTKSQIIYSIFDGHYKANKPRTSVAPPIQLFHPVFGHFLDDVKSSGAIPDTMVRQTTDYMQAASAIYSSEAKRRNELTPLLCDILGVDIQMIENEDSTKPDGTTESVKKWGRILLLLKEEKNEFGDGGSDPSTQAGLSAARCWAQLRFKELRLSTSCPLFLIATAGPWIAILGAVITDGVIVQRLTDYVWVGLDSVLNESHIINVARIFYALKASLEKLNSYYEQVQPTGDLPADSRYFPSITAYRRGNDLVQFKYVGFLEESSDCTTLHARTNTKPAQDIVVKFVDRYGERAHRTLADEGLAPKLFFYGSPRLDDGQPSYHSLSMVIMEYIDGKTLALTNVNKEMAGIVRVELQRALELLHGHGLVFGDLRSPNVMITKSNKVKLIDFNWAGEEGQAKYPYLISPQIHWPEGVKPLAVIEKNHDWVMLNRLF